jgi:hypothetical protein
MRQLSGHVCTASGRGRPHPHGITLQKLRPTVYAYAPGLVLWLAVPTPGATTRPAHRAITADIIFIFIFLFNLDLNVDSFNHIE